MFRKQKNENSYQLLHFQLGADGPNKYNIQQYFQLLVHEK